MLDGKQQLTPQTAVGSGKRRRECVLESCHNRGAIIKGLVALLKQGCSGFPFAGTQMFTFIVQGSHNTFSKHAPLCACSFPLCTQRWDAFSSVKGGEIGNGNGAAMCCLVIVGLCVPACVCVCVYSLCQPACLFTDRVRP